jgi:shikimate kinase
MTDTIDLSKSLQTLSKCVVLVGLMGAGKSSVGRRLARDIGMEFVDADREIEEAAGCSIADFFRHFGEEEFRRGEQRVIKRLLSEEPRILATGGGAFMSEETRLAIAERGISVWLRADLDTLFDRVSRRTGRPLLQTENPRGTLQGLMDVRYPVYASADLVVESDNGPINITVDRVEEVLLEFLAADTLQTP